LAGDDPVSHEDGGSPERPLLLVADDRPPTLRSLAERLDPAHYEVAVQPFGEDALRYVRERGPRAVVLNAERLYMDGHAPAEQIRAACPHTRILFLDEDGGWLLFIEPSGAEATDLLIHPCPAEEMTAALEEILRSPPRSPESAT
jgi:DNA-binding response OmpR family regulator